MMQLEEKRDARVSDLSGGMKRRLVLARALLNDPALLLLDEPTTGLDPQARHMIWQRVRHLKEAGTTIVLTTHYMEEASTLCDRVVLMDRGKILLEGRPVDLIANEVGAEVMEIWNHDAAVLAWVREHAWPHETHDGHLYIYLPASSDGGREFGHRFPHQERSLRPASLEDVFLRRAGRALRDGG
jgi:lipooligosaccharide transport system ATP-binding protein